MAQRDLGLQGDNPATLVTNPPSLPGYELGRGIPQPTPEGAPPGFGGQGVVKSPGGINFGLTPEQDRAVPMPPPGYDPSSLAPVKHAYEDSLLFKIGSVLSSYGETVPTNMKIKMAQQESDLKLSENRLAWNNYYKSNQLMRAQLQAHARDAMTDMFAMWPNVKGQISSTIDPVKRKQLADHWATSFESLSPGSGKMVQFYHDNMASVLDGDDLANDPDPDVRKENQDLIAKMGYDNYMQSKERMKLSLSRNTDRVTSVSGRMPLTMQQKLAAGKVNHEDGPSEAEFKEAFKASGLQSPLSAAARAASLHHLDTPEGQAQMIALGVHTNKLIEHKAMKEKDQSPIEEGRQNDYKEKKAILDDASKNPGKYTEPYLNTVREKVEEYLGTRAKQTNPGDNPNNTFNQQFAIDTANAFGTKGQANSLEDIAKFSDAQQAKYYRLADATKAKIASRQPNANMEAKMSTPGDTSQYVDAKDLRAGKLTAIRGTVAEGDLRDSSKYIKVTPDQKKELRDIEATAGSADQIFELAKKAYSGNDSQYLLATAEASLKAVPSGPGDLVTIGAQVLAKKNYPLLNDYVSRREATLGKFARSVSGEVGVLTDQDTARVRNLFPTAGDSAETRVAKRKALDALIRLNSKFAHQVLAGEMSPVEVENLKNSEQYRSAAQGILGSVEPKATGNSAKPSKPAGVDSLMESMEKGMKK